MLVHFVINKYVKVEEKNYSYKNVVLYGLRIFCSNYYVFNYKPF